MSDLFALTCQSRILFHHRLFYYHQLRDREIDGKPTSPRGKDYCPKKHLTIQFHDRFSHMSDMWENGFGGDMQFFSD
jgi:hypothetical protein